MTKSNLLPNWSDINYDREVLNTKISDLAIFIWNATANVRLKTEILSHYSSLLNEWADSNDMPLFIRKSGDKYTKGQEIIHAETGRKLVPTDNGPAHWVFSMAFNEQLPTKVEIKQNYIDKDLINIAMILTPMMITKSKYKCTTHHIDQPNKKGWKIAHIEEIGLNSRLPLEKQPIDVLKNHFLRFLNPQNMFLIPQEFSGLAEDKIFVTKIKHLSKG